MSGMNRENLTLFDLLGLAGENLTPESCKMHLACWNGTVDPLDVYYAGDFDRWQLGQRQRNFGREYVVSLIRMPARDRWLFIGVYRSLGYEERNEGIRYYYDLERTNLDMGLAGRCVVTFDRIGRQSYPYGETYATQMHVAEILAEPLRVPRFPGFNRVRLTRGELKAIVKASPDSWRVPLSSMSGLYIIVDQETCLQYVGSAYGEQGLWGRWCEYAKVAHGGNKELRRLLKNQPVGDGPPYENNFLYGILETADLRSTKEDVIERESFWKELLGTRAIGLNAN